jgi:hypothetical protein
LRPCTQALVITFVLLSCQAVPVACNPARSATCVDINQGSLPGTSSRLPSVCTTLGLSRPHHERSDQRAGSSTTWRQLQHKPCVAGSAGV